MHVIRLKSVLLLADFLVSTCLPCTLRGARTEQDPVSPCFPSSRGAEVSPGIFGRNLMSEELPVIDSILVESVLENNTDQPFSFSLREKIEPTVVLSVFIVRDQNRPFLTEHHGG